MNRNYWRVVALAPAMLALTSFIGTTAAQAHGKSPQPKPLVIKDQGSFLIGGEVKNRGPNDDVTINMMYVQYQVPENDSHIPIILTHGCCLSSKTWETTPDGRKGWNEYFLRQGYPVFLTDQSGRARSGFDATVFNEVRAGIRSASEQPSINHAGHQRAWTLFRFGPEYGQAWPDQRFPLNHVDDLYKQMIPDINAGLPSPNPSYKNLADLAVELDGAVLVGHSQSGRFPAEAALSNPAGASGLVLIEPVGCNASVYTSEQLKKLAQIPTLVVFGDHVMGTFWESSYNDCLEFVRLIKAKGGNAKMLYPPNMGIHGNSHMLMQDNNSDQIAGLISKWIISDVEKRRWKKQRWPWHHAHW